MTKLVPTAEVALELHTTRVALAPAGLDGRAAVVPKKAPLACETNVLEVNTALVVSGPAKTSKVPSVAPDPLGQVAPKKSIWVPTGPVPGWML